jgi:hypothetical protein
MTSCCMPELRLVTAMSTRRGLALFARRVLPCCIAVTAAHASFATHHMLFNSGTGSLCTPTGPHDEANFMSWSGPCVLVWRELWGHFAVFFTLFLVMTSAIGVVLLGCYLWHRRRQARRPSAVRQTQPPALAHRKSPGSHRATFATGPAIAAGRGRAHRAQRNDSISPAHDVGLTAAVAVLFSHALLICVTAIGFGFSPGTIALIIVAPVALIIPNLASMLVFLCLIGCKVTVTCIFRRPQPADAL